MRGVCRHGRLVSALTWGEGSYGGGFEVSRAKQKPVTSIITWLECFSRYVAVMVKHLPECASGMMSHQLTVLRAYKEVEVPAWCHYDEAYRENMAATGSKVYPFTSIFVVVSLVRGHPVRRALNQTVRGRRGHLSVFVSMRGQRAHMVQSAYSHTSVSGVRAPIQRPVASPAGGPVCSPTRSWGRVSLTVMDWINNFLETYKA